MLVLGNGGPSLDRGLYVTQQTRNLVMQCYLQPFWFRLDETLFAARRLVW